jgi:hypothetical protein
MYSGRRNRIPYERRVKQIQESIVYLEAITLIADMVIEARKKQDSKKLQQMALALQNIAFYVNSLETDRDNLVFTITR